MKEDLFKEEEKFTWSKLKEESFVDIVFHIMSMLFILVSVIYATIVISFRIILKIIGLFV